MNQLISEASSAQEVEGGRTLILVGSAFKTMLDVRQRSSEQLKVDDETLTLLRLSWRRSHKSDSVASSSSFIPVSE